MPSKGPTASTDDRPVAAIGLCTGALLAFSIQDVIIKQFSDAYSVWQLLSTRTGVVLLILVPIALALHGPKGLRAPRPELLVLRGVLAFIAFSSYYVAISVIPLADAAAMFATGPLFMTALSAAILRERVDARRWGATALGFAGVLIMLAPGSGSLEPAVLLPLGSAFTYAFIQLITRHVGGTTTAITMAIYSAGAYFSLCLIGAGVFAVVDARPLESGALAFLSRPWVAPGPSILAWMSLCGAVFSVGFVMIAEAYRKAPVSVVAPFEYSFLVWVALLGFLVFGDIPTPRTVLGAALVVGCGIYVTRRELRPEAQSG